jgi:DUF2946 family protein
MRGALFCMKWFRKHVKQGSRLALFTLAVQLALSFGHFHGLAAQAAPATLSGPAVAAVSGSDADGHEASSKPSPAGQQDHDQQPADNCAICAVMALTGTAMVSPPPVLLLPEAFEFLYRAADAEFIHLKSVGTAFQPRAPPAS